jgi:nucleotide-binding universal stress UspA family protein
MCLMTDMTIENYSATEKDLAAINWTGNSTRAIQINTIVVPIDFSSESFRVLDYAIVVAEQFGAIVHPVHVRPHDEAIAIERAGNIIGNYHVGITHLQDRLADIESKHRLKFAREQCHLFSGRPFEEICRLAREIDADLIILGSRGHSGLKKVLLGSTAERVVRYASCPVLVPRGQRFKGVIGLGPRTRLTMHNILVPVDFSDCSVAAVNYGVFLAKKFNAGVRLLHSVDVNIDFLAQSRISGALAAALKADELAAKNQMREFRNIHIPSSVSCETEILIGSPVDGISAASRKRETDLVAISTHGRTGVQHALIGSVAERVVRHAECPVLVVPAGMQRIPKT